MAAPNESYGEEPQSSIAAEASTDANAATTTDAMNVVNEDTAQTETQEASAETSASATAGASADGGPGVGINEQRVPQKKDQTLRQFLNKTDEYSPIIPDSVVDYYMTLGGLAPPPDTPRPLARLIALATQKFISDIAADAYQYARIRSSNTSSNNPMNLGAGVPGATGGAGGAGGASGAAGGAGGDKGKAATLGQPRPGYGGGGQGGAQGRTVLTMEDLGQAVAEYGINVKRGEWFR